MRMPGMTGLELHQQLVASGHGIPTVIITAHPEELTQVRAREAGITCYLIKPFAPDELLECVREALAKSRHVRRYPKVLGDYLAGQWRADRHPPNFAPGLSEGLP